jgi:hypothetical protein
MSAGSLKERLIKRHVNETYQVETMSRAVNDHALEDTCVRDRLGRQIAQIGQWEAGHGRLVAVAAAEDDVAL